MWNYLKGRSGTKVWFLTFQTLSNMDNIVLDNRGVTQSFTNNAPRRVRNWLGADRSARGKTRNVGLNVAWEPTAELAVNFDLFVLVRESTDWEQMVFANLGFRRALLLRFEPGNTRNLSLGNKTRPRCLIRRNYTSHVIIFGKPAFGGDDVHDTIYEPKIELTYKPSDGGILKALKTGRRFHIRPQKTTFWDGQQPTGPSVCTAATFRRNTVPASPPSIL